MRFAKLPFILSIAMSVLFVVKLEKRSELQVPVVPPTGMNDVGYWWVKEGNVPDVLVVMGGELQKVKLFIPKLMKKGYSIWVRKERCLTGRTHRCTEAFGYLSYLGDPDPAKPQRKWIVFLHGHTWSWHTKEIPIQTYLDRSLECAARRGVFTPVANTYYPDWFSRPLDHWEKQEQLWNGLPASLNYPRLHESYLGNPPGWTAWCCGEFIVPSTVLSRRTPQDYQTILNLSLHGQPYLNGTNGYDGFFFEFAFHLLFDMPARPDPTLKECSDLEIPVMSE